jgi:hypothetical protein
LKKKPHQQPPPLPDPNIDSNMERRDTKVTFAPSSAVTKPRASSSLVQNLEPVTQKIVNAEDRSEIRKNLWKEMSKCFVLNATLNAGSKKSNKSKNKKSSTVHHLVIMLSTDISGFEIEEHGLHQGVPFSVHPFKTLVASSTNHKLALGINELIDVGQRMKSYTITNRMGMRDFLGELKDLMVMGMRSKGFWFGAQTLVARTVNTLWQVPFSHKKLCPLSAVCPQSVRSVSAILSAVSAVCPQKSVRSVSAIFSA